jgi:hypothetical protein
MKRNNSSPRITGKTIDDIKRETNAAVSQLWGELNKLTEKVNHQRVGQESIESKDSGINIVKDGNSTYLEVKTNEGWERLDANFQPKTKRT